MRATKLILLALLFAFATVTLANAGTQVQQNQSTVIKASVKNTTQKSVMAAVKLTGYDDAGSVVGHLCQNVWLGEGRTRQLEFTWQAPGYATGLYWSSKIEVNTYCPSTTSRDDDDHEDDHEEHDD